MTLVNMRTLLDRADKTGKGCGAFNVGNMEMVRGVIRAAEETGTPVIMQIAEGRLAYSPLELMGPMMVQAARSAEVDVAVHFDHGRTVEKIRQALEFGFTSVMIDGSTLPFKGNVEKTKQIVELAKEYGADAEGEIGIVGGSEDGGKGVGIKCTDPGDAKIFAERTGVSALAVAIGNAHGNYTFAPQLEFGVLKQIYRMTDVPLVLHGGSGISDEDFQKAIKFGIRKVNIATASFNAIADSISHYSAANDTPDYFSMSEAMVNGVYENVKRHINVFNG